MKAFKLFGVLFPGRTGAAAPPNSPRTVAQIFNLLYRRFVTCVRHKLTSVCPGKILSLPTVRTYPGLSGAIRSQHFFSAANKIIHTSNFIFLPKIFLPSLLRLLMLIFIQSSFPSFSSVHLPFGVLPGLFEPFRISNIFFICCALHFAICIQTVPWERRRPRRPLQSSEFKVQSSRFPAFPHRR